VELLMVLVDWELLETGEVGPGVRESVLSQLHRDKPINVRSIWTGQTWLFAIMKSIPWSRFPASNITRDKNVTIHRNTQFELKSREIDGQLSLLNKCPQKPRGSVSLTMSAGLAEKVTAWAVDVTTIGGRHAAAWNNQRAIKDEISKKHQLFEDIKFQCVKEAFSRILMSLTKIALMFTICCRTEARFATVICMNVKNKVLTNGSKIQKFRCIHACMHGNKASKQWTYTIEIQ
jgi:hypothetical protein